MNNRKGFTLIEILIVVAIIGILASIALVGLRPAQGNARDGRRIADLRQVQNALELFYTRNGYYPPNTITAWTGASGLQGVLTSAGIGVSSIPNDPQASQNYIYLSNGAGTSAQSYILAAQLENNNATILRSSWAGSTSGYSGTATGVVCQNTTFSTPPYYYCLSL